MAGFRPCGTCLKEKYLEWKEDPIKFKENIIQNHEKNILDVSLEKLEL